MVYKVSDFYHFFSITLFTISGELLALFKSQVNGTSKPRESVKQTSESGISDTFGLNIQHPKRSPNMAGISMSLTFPLDIRYRRDDVKWDCWLNNSGFLLAFGHFCFPAYGAFKGVQYHKHSNFHLECLFSYVLTNSIQTWVKTSSLSVNTARRRR